jgi:hypothetical protein
MLVWIWHEHNRFFRRYGLQDSLTTTLNAALLFVVLFYVYPLKFMFDSLFAQFLPPPSTAPIVRMSLPQLGRASVIYGAGFCVLFLLFAALYARAWAKRDELGLTSLEVFEARAVAGHHLVSAGVGAAALIFALVAPVRIVFLSPMMFALMGPAHYAFGKWSDRRRAAYAEALTSADPRGARVS